ALPAGEPSHGKLPNIVTHSRRKALPAKKRWVSDNSVEAATRFEYLRKGERPVQTVSYRRTGRPAGIQPCIRLCSEPRHSLDLNRGPRLFVEGRHHFGLNGRELILEVAVSRHGR